MPETKLLLTPSDSDSLFEFALSRGAVFVGDSLIDTPQPELLSQLNRIHESTKEHLYLLHSTFTNSPLGQALVMIKVDDRRWAVKQRYGGPYIDFLLPLRERKGLVVPATIGHYPFFYDFAENRKGAGDALKRFYRSLCVHLRSHLKRVRLGKGWFYLGDDARLRLSEGWEVNLGGVTRVDVMEALAALQ
ncbi:MAG: hypothetical protein KF754_15295 [Planctomycetes bacterium]|nr:hypothetical protein [Planctomycetota bacterium]